MSLVSVAQNGNIALVQKLLDDGANPNIQTTHGYTALMMATSYTGFTDIVGLLLNRGAYPNMLNSFGDTALMLASSVGHTDIVNLLLYSGANPNIQNNLGDTALIMASLRGHTDIVELLLYSGANPNIQNNLGDTALIWANSGEAKIIHLLKNYMNISKIQSRIRGNITRNIARTQISYQQISTAQLPVDFDVASMIGKYLSRMAYDPEVAKRMK